MKSNFFRIIKLWCSTIVITLLFIGCGNSSVHEGQAKTPSGSSIQKGRNYEEVEKDFKSKGFKNISFVKMDDLITGWMTKDGEVESVSVDGDDGYLPDKWYSNNVPVVITYHTFPDKTIDDSAIESDTIENNTTENQTEESNYISEVETDNEIESVNDEYSSSSNRATAKRAFEKYGEYTYKYGIEYHWHITGGHIAEYESDGIWHFKVDVTITNESNASYDAVAEGRVDMIKEEVIEFNVSQDW